MTTPSGPPPDHRVGRQARLLVFLRGATAITVAACVLAVVVPGAVGQAAGAGAVAALVVVPLLRIVWLAQRWVRRGDLVYAGVACGLLGIIAAAALV
jgi:hypothetical protein